jgi:phosphoglycerate-specific signal transduction histidine kinase
VHELRTPLAIVCAEAEAARRRPREPLADNRVLDNIYAEGQRLRQLVDSLLMLARIDAGQPLVLAPLDLDDIVSDATKRIAPRVQERGLEIITLVGTTEPVVGDAVWLTQLLLNLLENAIRHTQPGDDVTLSVEQVSDGAVLSVADTGEGIPRSMCHTSSSVSIAPTSLGLAPSAVLVWAWRSAAGWRRPTTVASKSRVRSAVARSFACGYRRRRSWSTAGRCRPAPRRPLALLIV